MLVTRLYDQDDDEELTPSEAIRRGLCPMCLGRGVIYIVADQRTTPCDACSGSGMLEDVRPPKR